MDTDFPRILTLLRKEKNLSQKQAAMELGVSQALLSHYEKGIRECGLDFLVKTAEYYNVSCDYLLGRTPDRNGAKIVLENTTTPYNDNKQNSDNLSALHSKLILNSLTLIYDILEDYQNDTLTTDVSIYLMNSVYEMFRILYSANEKNPQAMFSVSADMQQALSLSAHILTEAETRSLLSENRKNLPNVTPENLSENYPELASSLYALINLVEKHFTKK